MPDAIKNRDRSPVQIVIPSLTAEQMQAADKTLRAEFLRMQVSQKSKDVRDLLGQLTPYVITVCDKCKQRCPIFHELTSSCIGASMTLPPRKAGTTKHSLYFVPA